MEYGHLQTTFHSCKTDSTITCTVLIVSDKCSPTFPDNIVKHNQIAQLNSKTHLIWLDIPTIKSDLTDLYQSCTWL